MTEVTIHAAKTQLSNAFVARLRADTLKILSIKAAHAQGAGSLNGVPRVW